MVGKMLVIFILLRFMAFLWRCFRVYLDQKKSRQVKEWMKKDSMTWMPPTRAQNISALEGGKFDILVIGGGSTGAGCVLDAASRGLKVALVEANDFASETSSKSTKLLHGGIRYLDKAIRKFSIPQLFLVFEALTERYNILRIAPYLTTIVPIMIPIYSRWQILYYWLLCKIYDALSGWQSLGRSSYLTRDRTILNFKNMKKAKLKGSIQYYDGIFDDARTNILLIVTAAFYHATVVNYVEFVNFVKNEDDKIEMAICRDKLTGKTLRICAKVFLSAAGPFTDEIRKKDNSGCAEIMAHSAGTHLAYPSEYGPERMGLVDSHTADNRLMFVLPWRGKTIVGSTEVRRPLQAAIGPTTEEIDFIHKELQSYVETEIDRSEILSAWCGLRPLVREKSQSNTESLVRSFKIADNGNGLMYATGGKWTTYRIMAEQCIDRAIKAYSLHAKEPCRTAYLSVIGSESYSRDLYYNIKAELNIEIGYAMHLLECYGNRAFLFREYLPNYPERLSSKYEFRVAEIIYCIENEFAIHVKDILDNRFRISFLEVKEAGAMASKVAECMGKYFNWSEETVKKETEEALESLKSFAV